MSRPRPPALIAALADIERGMRPATAARLHGVEHSSITRALQSNARKCTCCGQIMPKILMDVSSPV